MDLIEDCGTSSLQMLRLSWFKSIAEITLFQAFFGSADSAVPRASVMCNAAQDNVRHASAL